MGTNISLNIFKSFSYEVIERISRFILHLEEIKTQFYQDKKHSSNQHDLINSYKEVLFVLLNMAVNTSKECISEKKKIHEYFNAQQKILNSINELHSKWLSILPRPKEPVELIRFQRVIQKQVVMLDRTKKMEDFTISVNEQLGEEIYKNPLSEFIKNDLSGTINKYNSICSRTISDEIESEKPSHITIPRLDANNTLRWPSLLHEMSHEFYSSDLFAEDGILEEYCRYLGIDANNNEDTFLSEFSLIIEHEGDKKYSLKYLESWLVECWCDLFACILIGPAFYFSQYLAFLHCRDGDTRRENQMYPPVLFRLLLIRNIIEYRFPSVFKELEPHYKNCEEVITILDSDFIDFNDNNSLPYIYSAFNSFFRGHFFVSEKGDIYAGKNPALNKKLKKIVNKYVDLTPEISTYLKNQLKEGYPIPSIKTKTKDNKYLEYPTYVQEIFYASWLSRIELLQDSVFELIDDFNPEKIEIEQFFGSLRKPIERHDQAILKSIQVSEWFDLFIDEKPRPRTLQIWNSKEKPDIKRGLLVDEQIKRLIYSNKMQFIPLMDIEEQFGTTSIDVRLGAGFQIFYPDQYGIIDFTDSENSKSYRELSKRINLDFLEGVTITPGQFILAHSMEYIKLPDNISGNLDGRSSFARLGLEIHMTAGFIDPGFEGVITFEIYNAGASAVKLYPGLRIGQLRLERNSTPQKTYKQRHTVKYKGLLEHNVSKQSKDIEILRIKESKNKQK